MNRSTWISGTGLILSAVIGVSQAPLPSQPAAGSDAPQFGLVHSINVLTDGLVYV